jgi:K(+)-stimulated pyrophosphate-energized sodium pump
MGIFQSNAGGAWDNAKKSFEKGVLINGEMFYKKSEPHKASVTGDTVGDPFKDTSGPSMNILIKLMSIVSLVIAPYIAVNSSPVLAEGEEVVMVSERIGGPQLSMDIADTTYFPKGTYVFDKAHSFVEFGVRHFLSTATGSLVINAGELVITGNPATSSVFFELDVKTINTRNEDRDKHLNSADFFDSEKYPTIKYFAKSITDNGKNAAHRYTAKGELTAKGITKPYEVRFNYIGRMKNDDTYVYTFDGDASVNRADFGIGSTNPALGDFVNITFSCELNPKK